jgi:integrase
MRLTKIFVDKLMIPISSGKSTAQKRYYDDTLKGFGVRVTSGGTKAFFVEKNISHKLRRITIGRYPDLTVEQARKEANKLLGKIATGIDPVAEKQASKVKSIQLNQAFEDYLKVRKTLKPKTLYDYKRIMTIAFKDWQNKPLLSITKDNISKRHEVLAEKHGKAYANLAMRMLRAVFNFASSQYEDAQGRSLISENPIKRLSQTRAWYRIERRQTFIKAHELPHWYKAVTELSNETLSDYLLLILFTGLRRQEAAKLKWENIDLESKTLTISDTKNHETHTLPLSSYLYALLKQRKFKSKSEHVFFGTGAGGYIIEPRKQMAKIIERTGISFTVHDLRRTFITIAESLDISVYAVKRLVNHKMNNDVTAGYIVTDVERLRKPMQQITDYILSYIHPHIKGKQYETSLTV